MKKYYFIKNYKMFIILCVSIVLSILTIQVSFALGASESSSATPTQSTSDNITPTQTDGSTKINGFNFPLNKKAPDLVDTDSWINSDGYTSLTQLKERVVLVNFWTYTCINCIRTLPHIQALYDKYKDQGFIVIGVHTPEFAYEKKKENVVAAVKKYKLTYPVVQDNDYKTWRNYNNRYWPAQYLIDQAGNIRYFHFGENAYDEMDKAVKALLKNNSNT